MTDATKPAWGAPITGAKPPETEAIKIVTVKMVRNEEQFPKGPHTADVHPDEVANWSAYGWTVAE